MPEPVRVTAAATAVQHGAAGTTAASAVLDVSIPPAATAAAPEADALPVMPVHIESSGDGGVPAAEHSIASLPGFGQSEGEGVGHEGGATDARHAAGDFAPPQVADHQGAQQHAEAQPAEPPPAADAAQGLLAHAQPAAAAAAVAWPGRSTGMAEEEPGNELQAGEEPEQLGEQEPAWREMTAGGAAEDGDLRTNARGSSTDSQADEHGGLLAGAEAAGQLPLPDDGSASPSGKWREVGTAMGKKYLEAFKSRNQQTYAQVCCQHATCQGGASPGVACLCCPRLLLLVCCWCAPRCAKGPLPGGFSYTIPRL